MSERVKKKSHFVCIVSDNNIKFTLPYAMIREGVMNIPICLLFIILSLGKIWNNNHHNRLNI